MRIPPVTKEIAVATAAPRTPHPSPGIRKRRPRSVASLAGKIMKKSRIRFRKFTKMLIAMGIRTSCTARSTYPKTIMAARKIMGRHIIRKYAEASAHSTGSAPIHLGRNGLMSTVISPMKSPGSRTSHTDCAPAFRTVPSSPAPTAREITAITATPIAHRGELTSHVTLVVIPTAAEAAAPILPTIAESTY